MHGLQTPSSDDDVRYITMHSLREVISPFANEKIKVKDSGGDDVESWELCHFVKHLASGNPTCFEVIKSPLFTPSAFADDFRSLFPCFLDMKRICAAHSGYAEAQLKRYLRKADYDLNDFYGGYMGDALLLGIPKHEMKDGKLVIDGVWQENHIRRIPKSIVAGYRVLAQGRQLLETGDFLPTVKEYSSELHDKLMAIKTMDANTIRCNFVIEHLNAIEQGIQGLNAFYDSLPEERKDQKPDIDRIERFILEQYGHDEELFDLIGGDINFHTGNY